MPRPSHRGKPPVAERWGPVAALLAVALAVPVVARVADASPAEPESSVVSGTSLEGLPTAATTPAAPRAALAEQVDAAALASRPVPGQLLERAPEPKPEPKPEKKPKKKPEPAPFTVRVGSFNVLGSQHTDADGPRHRYPPATTRTPAAAGVAARHGVDILGAQELQADQLRGLQARTGMAAYPGFAWGEVETDNSILYDPSVFELVSGDRFTITFMGRPRPQPIARLRHLATGREIYVVNTHPSPGEGPYLAQRRAAQSTLVSVVNRLKASGLPVLVTGDMNDREAFYCQVAPRTGLTAPNGGSYGSGCQPPPQPLPVDWVVGTGVTWSGYWRDTSTISRRISDHFFISAMAHVP